MRKGGWGIGVGEVRKNSSRKHAELEPQPCRWLKNFRVVERKQKGLLPLRTDKSSEKLLK
jgi:hypothetical protein